MHFVRLSVRKPVINFHGPTRWTVQAKDFHRRPSGWVNFSWTAVGVRRGLIQSLNFHVRPEY